MLRLSIVRNYYRPEMICRLNQCWLSFMNSVSALRILQLVSSPLLQLLNEQNGLPILTCLFEGEIKENIKRTENSSYSCGSCITFSTLALCLFSNPFRPQWIPLKLSKSDFLLIRQKCISGTAFEMD